MSEIRLVRCPKCDKVLPEPPVFTVYQCGSCGAMLRANKKSSESEKLVNSDKDFNQGIGGEGIKDSGESREVEGVVLQESNFDMASKSPTRSTFGDGSGIKSTLEESDLNEFHGGTPKSPMRDRFLNDLSSSPVRSRNVSPPPMRSRNVSPSPMKGKGAGEFDFDGGDQSPARSRKVSMSPLREQRGDRSPMSVRTRNFSRSPMREVNGANNRSPARSLNENNANSPPRGGDVSGLDGSDEKEQEGTLGDCDEPEKEVRREKMTPKTSFNVWLSDEKPAKESNDSGLGRRRKKWKDSVDDDADRISEGKESGYGDKHGMTSEGSVDDLTHRDMRLRGDYVRGYRKAKANVDQQYIGSDGDGMIHTNSGVAVKSRRNSASSSGIDGFSSYSSESISNYGHSRRSYESPRGPSNVHYMDRVECTQNYKVTSDYSEEHLRFRQRYMQQYSPDKIMPWSSYYDHGPGLVHEMEDVYNHHSLYEDPYAGPMGSERFPKQPQFSRHVMAGYVPGKSLDFDQDSFRSYNNGMHRHYPADWQGHDLPTSFDSRISTNIPAHQSSSRSLDLQRPGPRTYDPRMSHTAPRERPSHLAPHRIRKVLVASQDKRLCLPIAGGSPFLLCHNCSELLKLPGKYTKKQKKECKLQCGACSSIISFDLQNMSSGALSSQKNPDTASAESGYGEVLNESVHRHRPHRDSFATTSTTIGSYDFDEGRHSFQSMESKANESSRGRKLASDYDGDIRAFSPPPRVSKEEPVFDDVGVQSSLPSSSEMPTKIRPPPGSPLREHLDYSGQYHKAKPENAISHNEKEKQELKNDTSQNSSVVAVASETEIDSHGLSNSFSDSGDLPREDNNKDSYSSTSPFWKSPFASRSGHASPGKGEVFVNGQHVPHHLVKKAEQLAGPIKPGDYWYDPKAGFWGVMGHHGLGIIPPSIPEFSFPMPESCSGGNTTVYVNGRELHKSDLNLLASRGFPTKRDKRYIIDISGDVTEEQSKDIVVRLGKLAPTVEKYKRGFGMHVPDKFKD